MHLLRRGGVFLCLMGALGAVGACSGEAPTNRGGGTESTGSNAPHQVIGRFNVTVDPSAAQPMTFEPIEGGAGGTSLKPQAVVSVLNNVTLSGAGTWDAGTTRLTAPVRITHNGGALGAFDEPQMVIQTITGTGAPDVVFETTDGGGSGVGATLDFADVQNPAAAAICPSGVKSSALHELSIYVPTGKSFNFTVDVFADVGGASVVPDCDGDGFNTEVGQGAGNDCNDANAALNPFVPPVTGNPNLPAAGGACTCSVNNNNAGSCTNPGASCGQTLTSGTYTCRADNSCSCDIDATGGTDVTATCQADCSVDCTGAADGPDTAGTPPELSCLNNCRNGASCDQTCQNGASGTCKQDCRAASDCDLDCSNNPSTGCSQDCRNANTTCDYDCKNNAGACDLNCQGGATCNMDCSNNPAGCAPTCNGSTCDLTCDNAQGTCLYSSCANSKCDATCTGSGSSCGMAACSNGAQCDVTCGASGNPAAYTTICGILSCRQSATKCNVTCTDSLDCFLLCDKSVASGGCTMDCSAIPVADRATKCDLVCQSPRTKQEVGGVGSGIYACL